MACNDTHDGCFQGDGEVKPTNWELGTKIANGNYSNVSHVIDINKIHSKKCVVKQAFISDDTETKYLETMEKEIKALRTVQHNRIVEYYGYSRTKRALSLFLPYMEKGSLATYMKSQPGENLTEDKTSLFTFQIIEGIEYLHERKIIHRDIKGSNILIVDDNNLKISDFGVAIILNTLSQAHTQGTGTKNWMAPEIFLEPPYNNKVDIWSLGCTVYQMRSGKIPFHQFTEMQLSMKVMQKELHLDIPEHFSATLKDFIKKCCDQEPKQRPTATELGKHAFVRERQTDIAADNRNETTIDANNSLTGILQNDKQGYIDGYGAKHRHADNKVDSFKKQKNANEAKSELIHNASNPSTPVPLKKLRSQPDWCSCGKCMPKKMKEKKICCFKIHPNLRKNKKLKKYNYNQCIKEWRLFKNSSLNKNYLDKNWRKFKFDTAPSTMRSYFRLACLVFKKKVTGRSVDNEEEVPVPACALGAIGFKFPCGKREDASMP